MDVWKIQKIMKKNILTKKIMTKKIMKKKIDVIIKICHYVKKAKNNFEIFEIFL